MKAELTLPPELVDQIAERVIEKMKPVIAGNGKHDPNDRWLNVKQLSEYIGMSCQWIYNNKNKLPHSNISNKPLFRKSEIDRWLESFRAKPKNEPINFSSTKENESLKAFRNQKRKAVTSV